MPPKRKRVFNEESKDGQPDKCFKSGSESVDSSFQYLNDDASRQIINFLTDSMKDLVALSLTASSWHNKVNHCLNKCIRKFMPLSYKRFSVAERNNKCAGFFKTEIHLSSVQIFAYKLESQEEFEGTDDLYIVPWDHNIVVHHSRKQIRILDLTKENELLSIETIAWYGKAGKAIVFNEKHKLLGVFVQEPNKSSLHVYSVNNGQVSLKCKDVIDETDEIEASIFIDDDKMVWIMSCGMLKCYSVDQNQLLDQEFLEDESEATLLSAKQATKGVDFYYRIDDEDYENVPIHVINSVAKRRKELLRLPSYDYPPTFDWQKDHVAIESTGSNCSHFYVYSREEPPKLRLYVSDYNGHNIEVSPDGTRFTFDNDGDSFDLYEITGFRARDEENDNEEEDENSKDENNENEDNEDEEGDNDDIFEGSFITDNKFSKKISTITIKKNKSTVVSADTSSDEARDIWVYKWVSKDVIVGLSVDSIAVMDLSSGQTEFEAFELPVEAQWVLYGATVSFVNKKTFMISAYSKEDELFVCKITL